MPSQTQGELLFQSKVQYVLLLLLLLLLSESNTTVKPGPLISDKIFCIIIIHPSIILLLNAIDLI